jgi:hypothetical protein
MLAGADADMGRSAVEAAVACIHGIDKRGTYPSPGAFRIGCIKAPLHNHFLENVLVWIHVGKKERKTTDGPLVSVGAIFMCNSI